MAFLVSFSFLSVAASDDQEVIITDSGQIHIPLSDDDKLEWYNFMNTPAPMSEADYSGLMAYYSFRGNYNSSSATSGSYTYSKVNTNGLSITLPWSFSYSYDYATITASSYQKYYIPINYAQGDNLSLTGLFNNLNIANIQQIPVRSVVLQIFDASTDTGYSMDLTDFYSIDTDGHIVFDDVIYEKVEVSGNYINLTITNNAYNSGGVTNNLLTPFNIKIGIDELTVISGSEIVMNQQQMMTQLNNLESAIAELTQLVESQDRDYTEILEAILEAIDDGNTQVTNAIINMMNQNESRQIEIINKLGDILNVEIEQKNLLQQLVDFFYDNMTGAEESQNNALDKADELTSQNQQLEQIEQSTVQDFNNNLSNLDTNLDLFSTSDFVSSANFLATNMTRIVQTNSYIQYMITFSLIIGFALVLIGRGLK